MFNIQVMPLQTPPAQHWQPLAYRLPLVLPAADHHKYLKIQARVRLKPLLKLAVLVLEVENAKMQYLQLAANCYRVKPKYLRTEFCPLEKC